MSKSAFLKLFDNFPLIPFLDYFVYEKFHHDNDTLYRARILAAMIFFNMLVIFSIPIVLLFVPSMGDVLVANIITVTLGSVFIGLLYVLRRFGCYMLCCNVAVVSGFVSITAGIIISGGPLQSPAIQLAFIPSIMMFCLGGMGAGFAWSGVVLVTQLVLVAMGLSGFAFPNVLNEGNLGYNWFLDWVIGFFSMTIIIVTYEYLNLRLKGERDREHEKYVFQARHDSLTELPNRNMFSQTLKDAFRRAHRTEKKVALLYIDLDGFKPINDQLGHEGGDVVLVSMAKRLRNAIRETDMVARIGGDEFAIVLEGLNETDSIQRVVENVLEAIAQPIEAKGHSICITGSIGVSIYPDHTHDMDTMLRYSDLAMYKAKQNRNTWSWYDESSANLGGMSPS